MPSRIGLLAMAAPPDEAKADPDANLAIARPVRGNDVAEKQRKVWDSVAATQNKLSGELSSQIFAAQSATSLQLTLEHERLKEARAHYIMRLKPAGLSDNDIVGYVVAINGRLSAANVYPSNGLFRKMWTKQLAASVTEAIGERREGVKAEAPKPSVVGEFLAAAERAKGKERVMPAGMRVETRDADAALYNEARQADGRWVHRSYLAK
jgi:hypothetical protein